LTNSEKRGIIPHDGKGWIVRKLLEIVTRLKRLWAISATYDKQLEANAKAMQFVNNRINDHITCVNARLHDYQLREDAKT